MRRRHEAIYRVLLGMILLGTLSVPVFSAPRVYRAREKSQFKKEDFPAYVEALIFDQKDSWTDILSGPIKPQWGKIDAVNSLTWGRWTVSFSEKSPVVEWNEVVNSPLGNVFFYNLACRNPVLGERTCLIRLVTNAENGQWLRCVLEIPLEDEKSQRVLKKEKAFNINCPTEFRLK